MQTTALVLSALFTAMAVGPAGAAVDASGDVAVAPECAGHAATIVGTDGDDEIVGTTGADVIVALDGEDRVRSGPGPDVICGGPLADFLDGEAGRDRVYGGGDDLVTTYRRDFVIGGSGDDVLWADAEGPGRPVADGGGGDALLAEEGDDRLVGGPGADTLGADEGNDRVNGRGGNDYVSGAYGDDYLQGGGGHDTLAPDQTDDAGGSDQIVGGAGRDTVSYQERNESVDVDLAAGFATGAGFDVIAAVEDAEGGRGDDLLAGTDGPNALSGGDGADRLTGLGGDDLLSPDWSYTRADDTVDGGTGVDEVDYSSFQAPVVIDLAAETTTGAGTDNLPGIENATGTEDSDRILGDAADNTLKGVARDDTIVGRGGTDTGNGGGGTDTCDVEVAVDCEG
ncbi:MAG: hypothetical protein H0U77_05475 [Nocardioidaceae bacterium]|nr:hypothetical protein [Nocardioidaceae bacterium]